MSVIGLVTFTVVLLASLAAGLAEDAPAERKAREACFFVAAWGGMIVLFGWNLLKYRRYELRIENNRIVEQSLLRTTALDLSELREVQWRVKPLGGSILLRAASAEIRICLGSFLMEQRQFLIHFFRRGVPEPLQRGWIPFAYKMAMPQRERMDDRPLRDDEVLVTRRRWDWVLLPWIAGATILCSFLAWYSHNFVYFFAPVGLTVLWLLMRFTLPPKGARGVRVSSPRARPFVLLYVPLFGSAIAFKIDELLYPAHDGPVNRPIGLAIIATIVLLSFGAAMVQLARDDRKPRCDDEAKAAAAVAEWERQQAEAGM